MNKRDHRSRRASKVVAWSARRNARKPTPAKASGERPRAKAAVHLPGAATAFPIVGIGASAGGLEAFTELLKHLPLDTGMGFVLVQHLDPVRHSALTELLAKATQLPVREVTRNARVEPNRVYVIAPNTNLTIEQGVLKLRPRQKTGAAQRSVDFFFESLAQDQHERAIGVILSGAASDGTLGLETIKGEGGITFAQDESARYDSMPRSAVAAGCVDFVLAPANIAKELARIAKHPYVAGQGKSISVEEDWETATAHEDDETALLSGGDGTPRTGAKQARVQTETARAAARENGLKRIFLLLRNHSGVDFSLYKSSTIQRRIHRRIVLNKLDSLAAYARFLRGNAIELTALYSDALISVTSFFRNPEAFEFLQRKVFAKILAERRNEPVRVWTLGCSSGQEAYSIAMAFTEFFDSVARPPKLQIFATDLNDTLLEKARAGLYAKSLVHDISPERLRRFFTEEEGGYRISKPLRDAVVFARQNLISDPPFSRMDLISCRNLLIYIEPSLQKKVLPTFHYALRPNGFLFLGAAEGIGGFTDLFQPVDRKHKIYSRKPGQSPPLHLQRLMPHQPAAKKETLSPFGARSPEDFHAEVNVQREADRITLSRYAPTGVLVNTNLQVLQFRGETSAFLKPPMGQASFNLLKMAREGLMLPLRAAINQAKKENKTVRRENVRVNRNGKAREVNLEVTPLKNLKERCYLIFFDEGAIASVGPHAVKSAKPVAKKHHGSAESRPSKNKSRRIAELQTELAETRDYLQSLQEQQEAAHEELQASNEEVTSANEELQSTNEELETSKEELESANEELTTVNEEMVNRNAELSRLNSDLVNLQTSTRLAIVLLGGDLTIRRFSAQAEKQFNLRAGDVGRPFSNVRHNLDLLDLEGFVAEVIDSVREREHEVRDKEGRWYSLRVRPYLTLEKKIDGAVLVLVDITDLKQTQREITEARDHAESIIRTARDPMLVLSADLRVVSASEALLQTFKLSQSETEGRLIYKVGNGEWNIPRLRQLLQDIILHNSFFNDFEVTQDFERIGRRTVLLDARILKDLRGQPAKILLGFHDITEHKEGEVLLDSQREALQLLAEGAPLENVLGFLVGIVEHHSVEGMLAAITPLNEAGTHFQRGIGASLPDAFSAAVEGVAVSSPTGLCADAVRRRESVAVHDFNEDPAWQPFGKFVAPYGLRSGWSTPILSSSGQILGTFANYYRHTGDPTPQNLKLVEMVVRTAAIAIDRRRAEEALRKSEERARTLFEAAESARLTAESAKTRAEAATRAKDDFLAALSHELRTPLSPALLLATSLAMTPRCPRVCARTLMSSLKVLRFRRNWSMTCSILPASPAVSCGSTFVRSMHTSPYAMPMRSCAPMRVRRRLG